jgi:hypothetical protein
MNSDPKLFLTNPQFLIQHTVYNFNIEMYELPNICIAKQRSPLQTNKNKILFTCIIHNICKFSNHITHQVIDDMRAGRVPPGIAEPLAARRDVAAHYTGRIGHSAVPARVLREIPFPVLVAVIVSCLLEVQPSHPGR